VNLGTTHQEIAIDTVYVTQYADIQGAHMLGGRIVAEGDDVDLKAVRIIVHAGLLLCGSSCMRWPRDTACFSNQAPAVGRHREFVDPVAQFVRKVQQGWVLLVG
jgi:hypothetical protein